MIPPDKKHNQPPEDLEGVYFTRGPMYINHFYEISKCGINALRLYQYIRTVQGLKWPSLNETSHKPVKIDNKKLYASHSMKYQLLHTILKNFRIIRLPTDYKPFKLIR